MAQLVFVMFKSAGDFIASANRKLAGHFRSPIGPDWSNAARSLDERVNDLPVIGRDGQGPCADWLSFKISFSLLVEMFFKHKRQIMGLLLP